MRKGKRSRNIVEAIKSLLSDGEWYGLYDIVDLTGCGANTIRRLMGMVSVERKRVSKGDVDGTFYRLKKEEKKCVG